MSPSTFSVQFGEVFWRDIEVKNGEQKILNPGVIELDELKGTAARVFSEDGKPAGRIVSS